VGCIVPVGLEVVTDLEGLEVTADDVGKHAYSRGVVDVCDGHNLPRGPSGSGGYAVADNGESRSAFERADRPIGVSCQDEIVEVNVSALFFADWAYDVGVGSTVVSTSSLRLCTSHASGGA
jgi:hypothetical protein